MSLEAENLKIEITEVGVEFGDAQNVLSESGDKAPKNSEIFKQNMPSKGITFEFYLNCDVFLLIIFHKLSLNHVLDLISSNIFFTIS